MATKHALGHARRTHRRDGSWRLRWRSYKDVPPISCIVGGMPRAVRSVCRLRTNSEIVLDDSERFTT